MGYVIIAHYVLLLIMSNLNIPVIYRLWHVLWEYLGTSFLFIDKAYTMGIFKDIKFYILNLNFRI